MERHLTYIMYRLIYKYCKILWNRNWTFSLHMLCLHLNILFWGNESCHLVLFNKWIAIWIQSTVSSVIFLYLIKKYTRRLKHSTAWKYTLINQSTRCVCVCVQTCKFKMIQMNWNDCDDCNESKIDNYCCACIITLFGLWSWYNNTHFNLIPLLSALLIIINI